MPLMLRINRNIAVDENKRASLSKAHASGKVAPAQNPSPDILDDRGKPRGDTSATDDRYKKNGAGMAGL